MAQRTQNFKYRFMLVTTAATLVCEQAAPRG